MNKAEYVDYISKQHDITKVEAEKVVNIFTSSATSALSEGKDISLTGFGKFYTSQIPAREGRNPRTGETLHIPAYVQAKFSGGQSLKDACNTKKK